MTNGRQREHTEHAFDDHDALSLVAHHEAGHAVARHVLFPSTFCHFVRVIRRGDYLGEHAWEFPLSAKPTEIEIESAVVTLCAGFAAHLHLVANDTRRARLWASDDDSEAARFLAMLDLDADGLQETEARLRERASSLVDAEWPAIEALATELVSLKRIEGDEVAGIIEVAHGVPGAEEGLAMLRQLKAMGGLGK